MMLTTGRLGATSIRRHDAMKKLEQAHQRELLSKASALASLEFSLPTQLEQADGGATAIKLKLKQHLGLVSPELPKKGIVYLERRNNLSTSVWSIRVSICGYSCVVGRLHGTLNVIEQALRFADMARLYFWKYRVRDRSAPTDEDFNFSKAQAELDLKMESKFVEILDEQASFLTLIGVLSEPTEKEHRSRPTDQLNSRMGSLQLDFVNMKEQFSELRASMCGNVDILKAKLDEMALRLNDLSNEIHEVKQFNSTLVGTLQQLAYAVHSLHGGTAFKHPDQEPVLSPAPVSPQPNLVSCGGTTVLPSAT